MLIEHLKNISTVRFLTKWKSEHWNESFSYFHRQRGLDCGEEGWWYFHGWDGGVETGAWSQPSLALITRFHFPWLNRCNITRWGDQQPCPGLDIYLYTTYLYTIHSAVTVYSTGVTLQDGVASSRVHVHHNYNLCHGQADMEITGQQIWFNFSFIALSQFGWLQPPRGRSYSSWDGMKYIQNFNAL